MVASVKADRFDSHDATGYGTWLAQWPPSERRGSDRDTVWTFVGES
jgi:hypothetical protein